MEKDRTEGNSNEWNLKDGVSRRLAGTTGEYMSQSEGQSVSNVRILSSEYTQQMPIVNEYDWLQLGPTCIPFGETDSPARVIVSGRITSIVINPKKPEIIFVGTAQGGVWKTIDNGRNWKATTDDCLSLAIGALAIDPKNTNVLYAGTGEGNLMGASNPDSYYGCGILKTTDGGDKWEIMRDNENNFVGTRFFRIAINPKDTMILFAATSKGVYRSLNGGEEWKLMTGLPRISGSVKAVSDIVIDPNSCEIVYAALWGDGIYKTTNSNSPNPVWKKIEGLQQSNIGRIAICISKTNSKIIYTLMSGGDPAVVMYFYMSEDSGSTWTFIHFPDITIKGDRFNYDENGPEGIGLQGNYNLNIAVDPDDNNTVYLSAMPLLKAIRNPRSKNWMFIDVGRNIHTDNHAFAFHPTDNMIIFTGNDGGIYKSTDGGLTWDDTMNEGLCITEFEFMGQHPESDAVIIAGTQDNGTLQFRNSPAFYFCSGGDGGFAAIDPNNPNIVYHTDYGPTIHRSDEGGMFGLYENGGSWKPLYEKIDTDKFGKEALFYPPFAFDQSDPNNLAMGTKNIYLYDQRQKKWETIDTLGLSAEELISAINYIDSNLLCAGTTLGNMFLLKKINNKWTTLRLEPEDIALPGRYIWDIITYREGNEYLKNNTIIVALGGFNADKEPSHVWRGEISDDNNTIKWENISGEIDDNKTYLPNCPANAITMDFFNHDIIYVGTDLGVFRTMDGGKSWERFGKGLPNCAVLDIRLLYYKDERNYMRLLRLVTHGRGMWELEVDRRSNKKEVDLYVRDHVMDTGRFTPSKSGSIQSSFEDPLRNIKYVDEHKLQFDDNYDYLYWWMCADIKVDPPYYQMDIDDVDYVKFEYRIRNKNPIAGEKNRVYVQVHNRGIKNASNVTIKLFYAKIIDEISNERTKSFEPKLPELSQNFWREFLNDHADSSPWEQIGEKISLPMKPKTLTNVEPTVICWEWDTPKEWEWETSAGVNDVICDRVALLVVMDSIEDPIPEENKKIIDAEELVRIEKHVGVRVLKVDRSAPLIK